MIENNQIKNSNIFNLFPAYNLEMAEYAPKQKNKRILAEPVRTKENLSDQDSLQITTSDKNNKSKTKKIIFGSTLASTIFVAGVLSLFFAKGFHGSSFKRIIRQLEKRAKVPVQNNMSAKEYTNKAIYEGRRGFDKAISMMDASSNFTALKDWVADKIFRSNKVTSKYADSTQLFFKGVVDKTLGKKYDKVEVNVKNLTSLVKHITADSFSGMTAKEKLQKVKIKEQVYTLGEIQEILLKHAQKCETLYDDAFSLGARRLRDKKRSKMLEILPTAIRERFFKDKKSLLNPENYKTYVTDDVTRVAQEELKNEIITARKSITNNITTINENIRTALSDFSKQLKPDDETLKEALKQLKSQMDTFKKLSGPNEVKDRRKVSKEISVAIDKLISMTKKSTGYTPEEQEEMMKLLQNAKDTVMSAGVGSKGSIEEIMTLINGLNKEKIKIGGKEIVSNAQLKEYRKLAAKISKDFTQATELETGEYFLKQAELKVGSAATDVLSLFFPIGVGAYAILKGEDKDERISATLTTCVPLVGTFATFIYGTSKMLSGAKNLMFSFISGIVLSKLGNYCDKLYKKYKDTGSIKDVVKDEYDHFWTDISFQYAQPLKPEENKK